MNKFDTMFKDNVDELIDVLCNLKDEDNPAVRISMIQQALVAIKSMSHTYYAISIENTILKSLKD